MKSKLHFEILSQNQIKLLEILAKQNWLSNFYLAGGTSIALQIVHRQSINFDFFTENDIHNITVISKLTEIGRFELFSEEKNTINGSLNDVKISFISYKYKMLNKFQEYKTLRIADLLDVALMKLVAISQRGSKKDFIDLYFLLNYYSLPELFKKYEVKYGLSISNQYHLLKSLIYFKDAENTPMPVMVNKKISWQDIKMKITNEVKKLNQFFK